MRFLLIIFALLSFGSAHGADRQVEHFYQAEKGKLINFFSIEYSKLSLGEPVGSATEISNIANTVRFEKGILDYLSIGTNLRFSFEYISNDTADVSHTGASMQNPEFYVYTTFNFGKIDLKAGLTLDYSYEKSLVDADGLRTNQVSGRHAATPYLGFNYNLSSMNAGMRVSQEIALSDIETQSPNDTVVTTTGGEETTVDIYGEYQLTSWVIGVLLKYTIFADTVSNSISSTVPGVLRINPYFPVFINETLTLRPELYYDLYQDKKIGVTTYDSIDNFGFNLQARFLF